MDVRSGVRASQCSKPFGTAVNRLVLAKDNHGSPLAFAPRGSPCLLQSYTSVPVRSPGMYANLVENAVGTLDGISQMRQKRNAVGT